MERIRMRSLIKFILALLLGLIIFSVSVFGAASYLNGPVGTNGQDNFIFSIEKGDTLYNIANSLEESGVIKYSWPLILYSRFIGTEADFKVGIYRISSGMSLIEIHDFLIEGRQQLYRVTIPEGWTSRQIADYLGNQNITGVEDFLQSVKSKELMEEFSLSGKSLEGFLYPDTYLFQRNFPAEKIIRVMVQNFFSKLLEIYPQYEDLNEREFMEKIILASIVEREYRDPNEAPLMAGVFYNRLSHNTPIPLGSCATIVYIIADIQSKPHPEVLTYSDLKILSPYNTYINSGLPPGPISNPGEVALKASFYPKESDYLYFLLKNPESGQHEFTKNLSEHTAAYNLYIKKN